MVKMERIRSQFTGYPSLPVVLTGTFAAASGRSPSFSVCHGVSCRSFNYQLSLFLYPSSCAMGYHAV